MNNTDRWTMPAESAWDYWESEHPVCEQCGTRCCIRPADCSTCPDGDIGVAVGPDRLHVHVGCKDAYSRDLAVMVLADAIKVLRTRDGVAVTDAQCEERARNAMTALMVGPGWGPL